MILEAGGLMLDGRLLKVGGLRVDKNILQDPRYLMPGKVWCHSILRSCKTCSINSRIRIQRLNSKA